MEEHKLIINPGEIHLWCVYNKKITEADAVKKYYHFLDTNEKEQQKRFHFPDSRHQYLITRALARIILSKYFNKPNPEGLKFKKCVYGKPYIDDQSLSFPLEFNISHSKQMVVMAVTNGVKIGVDVENTIGFNNTMSIVNRYFSISEINAFNELNEALKNELFFELWTLKEAYIKARGLGLFISLDKFSFLLNEKISIQFDIPHIIDNADNWRFWQIEPNDTHKIAIAVEGRNIKNNPFSIKVMDTIPLVVAKVVDYPIVRTG